MHAGTEEARRYALGLLRGGMSPEQAEAHLAGRLVQHGPLTALTDPSNVLMKEVPTVTEAHARGPVDIMGVTTRTNTSEHRACVSCLHRIDVGRRYERVARKPGPVIESYHVSCFEDEFGARELYGD
jgi:hypothetical protein